MAKGINQKGKILYLEKILRETSETHPCTMQEILGKLQEYGISAERKSIYDDMEVLRSFGMNIRFKRGKSTGYFVDGEQVSTVEIKVDSAPVETKKVSWLLPPSDSEENKPLKLLCSNRKKEEVMGVLGDYAQYKEKEGDSFTAAAQIDETCEFYGWLTEMGRDVVLLKPKKAVQAYREYLKGILKEYK